MSKVRAAPQQYVTGGTLSPRLDLNRNHQHIADTIRDVAEKRYAHFELRLPFQRSTTTPYTDADSDGVREYWFRFPYRVSVERAFLRFYGTGDGTNPVTISIYDESGNVVEDDLLSVQPTASAADHSDFSAKRLEWSANTYYRVRIESAGTFSSSHTFVELHLRADRWNTAASDVTPSYTPTRLSAGDTRDASVINDENTTIDTEVAKFAANDSFMRAELYVAHDIAAGASADLTKWRIPTDDYQVVTRQHVQTLFVREVDPAPGVATGGDWTILKAAGGVTGITETLTATTAHDKAINTTAHSFAVAGSDHNDSAKDYTIDFEHTTGADTVDKAYALVVYK